MTGICCSGHQQYTTLQLLFGPDLSNTSRLVMFPATTMAPWPADDVECKNNKFYAVRKTCTSECGFRSTGGVSTFPFVAEVPSILTWGAFYIIQPMRRRIVKHNHAVWDFRIFRKGQWVNCDTDTCARGLLTGTMRASIIRKLQNIVAEAVYAYLASIDKDRDSDYILDRITQLDGDVSLMGLPADGLARCLSWLHAEYDIANLVLLGFLDSPDDVIVAEPVVPYMHPFATYRAKVKHLIQKRVSEDSVDEKWDAILEKEGLATTVCHTLAPLCVQQLSRVSLISC